MNAIVIFSICVTGILAWGIQPLQTVSQVAAISPNQELDERIPAADPQKYKGINDAGNWLNPYLIIRAEGIEVIGKGITGRKLVATETLRQTLVSLSVDAWPYGRVVAAQDAGLRNGSGSDEKPINRNHRAAEAILKALGVKVEWWPGA
jgi:hypothetical protein